MTRFKLVLKSVATAALLVMTMGAKGDGCAANSTSDAPDVEGTWDVTYDDMLGVEIKLGGSTYTSELGVQGGAITINHNGKPFTFNLNCARPEVICPSEAWPKTVTAEQRNTRYEHRMIVTLPVQSCSGALVKPAAAQCGAGTLNPNCDLVCSGEVTTRNQETFGVIGESGDSFRLYLGGGVASNGINCVLLGGSVADAHIDSTGRGTPDWQATAMSAGLVTVGYAGGCLWAGDPNMDGQTEALVLGASVKFTTGFTAARR